MTFTVIGKPQGKARPRFSRKSGTVYTPSKTEAYERQVRAEYLAAHGRRYDDDADIRVTICSYFAFPKSWSKKKRSEWELRRWRPRVKPDADNIAKIVLDALNGTAYKDDAQVSDLRVKKRYGVTAMVVITIAEDKE